MVAAVTIFSIFSNTKNIFLQMYEGFNIEDVWNDLEGVAPMEW